MFGFPVHRDIDFSKPRPTGVVSRRFFRPSTKQLRDRRKAQGKMKIVGPFATAFPAAGVETAKEERRVTHPNNWIIADHGIGNIAGLMRDPEMVSIAHPSAVMHQAKKHDMGVLYLYRELRDTMNSLAHFVCRPRGRSGRKRKLRTLDEAMKYVIDEYAPRFAEHIRVWKADFKDGMIVTYGELQADTKGKIINI